MMLLTSSWLLYFLVFLVGITVAAYKYLTRHFDYWKIRGVKGPNPVPFYGNCYEIANFKTTISEGLKKLYDSCDGPYVGIFVFDKPVLLLKSRELINDVLVKDASVFLDKTMILSDHNKIIKNLLFFQNGPAWKSNRSKLSTCFSPLKIKGMYSFMEETVEKVKEIMSGGDKIMDVKEDITGKFFVEILARCMLGIQAHCFEDKEAGFLKAYKGMFAFTWRNVLSQGATYFMGEWVNPLRLNFIHPSITEYLSSAVEEALKIRTPQNGKARDLIDVLNDMQNNSGIGTMIGLEQILANGISFLIAGVETSASVASYTLYEFAINQHIQERVRKEILDNIEEHGGITFEGTQKSSYLELCIYETIRKYAVVPHICRKAGADYTFSGTNLTIEKGTSLYIPIYALQMDEKYFPEPKKYYPERMKTFKWNDNGKLNYLPFGAGPRHCIGDRFAMTAMKVLLMQILSKNHIDRCENTPDELIFETKCILLKPKTGNLLKIKPLINVK